MNSKQLQTFLTLSELNNFTATANKIGYAQSTVTTQIKLLEDELGITLFERMGKHVALTQDGKRLIPYAKKIINLENEIYNNICCTDEPTGELRIGVSESLCYVQLPKLLKAYRQTYPQVDIHMELIDHTTFPQLLQNGELDFVYMINPKFQNENFITLYEKPEELNFYVNPQHELTNKSSVYEEDIIKYPLLITSKNCNFHLMLKSDLAEKGLTPNIALETTSKEILKQFAINGFGITFIPAVTAEREVKNNLLKPLAWKGKTFEIYSQIIIHKDKKITPNMKAFWCIYDQLLK